MTLVDRVYQSSPIWIQQAIVAAYGVWWHKRRFNATFHRLVREFEERSHASAAQFTDYGARRLATLFEHARSSTYYKPFVSGIDLADPSSALAKLPFLTKETLRSSAKDLLTASPPRGTMIQRSSGTTGTPSEIYYTRELHAFELAVPEARNLRWAGVNYRDRRVMFGARKICHWAQKEPPFWRVNPYEDMAYCSIYHLSARNLPSYFEFLARYKPAVVMGYPSALGPLAQFALETKTTLPPARAIITTSETLTAETRENLERLWGCKVWDRYGAVEGCLFASQCEHGRYHVSPDVGIVEVVDERGQPCPPGVIGEVVATGLHNTLQPLIRYRLGDAARWAVDQTCRCGRQMPILEAIEGRFEDICITSDGRKVLRFDTVFKGVASIKEAQVIQRAPDHFEILVVEGAGFGAEDIRKLQSNMAVHVGPVRTDITIVPEIARSSSGKFRAVLCQLTPDQKRQLERVGT
jgi:phenylacetate-CoA ligase